MKKTSSSGRIWLFIFGFYIIDAIDRSFFQFQITRIEGERYIFLMIAVVFIVGAIFYSLVKKVSKEIDTHGIILSGTSSNKQDPTISYTVGSSHDYTRQELTQNYNIAEYVKKDDLEKTQKNPFSLDGK